MAKEIAIGKRAKISEAQQYMILAVLGAAVVLGIAIALVTHFVKQIGFNKEVIMAKDEAIVAYSNVIQSVGVCKSPRGKVYSADELRQCDPNSIEVSEIPGTLRSNILEGLAANQALNSVPKEDRTNCTNPDTNKNYTYEELNKQYEDAEGSEQLTTASLLIMRCSALRVVPDALPSIKNEEALLASLNKLFQATGLTPKSLSPSGTVSELENGLGLNAILVNLALEDVTSAETPALLNNIERSIRQFNFQTAAISWKSDDTLSFNAQAIAFYMNESILEEVEKTIVPGEERVEDNGVVEDEE